MFSSGACEDVSFGGMRTTWFLLTFWVWGDTPCFAPKPTCTLFTSGDLADVSFCGVKSTWLLLMFGAEDGVSLDEARTTWVLFGLGASGEVSLGEATTTWLLFGFITRSCALNSVENQGTEEIIWLDFLLT